MTWSEIFLNDYYPHRELKRVNQRIRAEIDLRNASSRRMRDRFEELEEENARLALMLRALTEMCQRKGVFSIEEMQQMVAEVDAWDGVVDGRYGLPPHRDEVSQPSSTHEFLEQLERRDRKKPDDQDADDFLGELEGRDDV